MGTSDTVTSPSSAVAPVPSPTSSRLIGRNAASVIIALIFLAFIANSLFIDRGYYESMPQDLFGYLDGVYRTYLGQVAHRDFATPLGPVVFLVPAIFMKFGAGALASVRYYTVAQLVLTFCIVLYLQRTRLEPLLAIAFGATIAILVATKLMLGDANVTDVTAAMFYNRFGYISLILIVALFVPPPEPRSMATSLVDGALAGLLCGVTFYTKLTFGLVGLALVGLSLFSERRLAEKLAGVVVAAAVFLVIVVLMEFAYGVRFHWVDDIRMAAASAVGTRTWKTPIRATIVALPEVIAGIVVPLVAMHRSGFGLRPYWLLLAAAILGASGLLAIYAAQGAVLVLPLAFLIAASARLNEASLPRPGGNWVRLGLNLWTILILAGFSWPLLYNIAYSSTSYRRGAIIESDNPIVKSIRTGQTRKDVEDWRMVEKLDGRTPLEAFMIARNSKRPLIYDHVSFREYGIYVEDGLKAARAGCPDHARIATFDSVNPFPLLLGWPEGHEMLFINERYLVSKQSHPTADRMLGDIDCVMLPEMETVTGTRAFLEGVYADYLRDNFTESHHSKFWTVLIRKGEKAATP